MSAWSGLIHQISQGVTNQVVSHLTTRLSQTIATPKPPSESGTPLTRAHSTLDEWEARIRAKHASAWQQAARQATPDGGNGAELAEADARRTKATEARHEALAQRGDVPEFKADPTSTAKPQSALGELLTALAASAKQAVAPITARWQAVRNTTRNYLQSRSREFKRLDRVNASESTNDPIAPAMADKYEASKRQTRNARRSWVNALMGRGDVVNAARQRYSEAKASSAADPTNAAKSAHKAETLADLQKASQLAGGKLSSSVAGGLSAAATALGKAGGHLGTGFVGRVSGAVSKLTAIGGTIGAGFVRAIPIAGQIIGAIAAVAGTVSTLSRITTGRIEFLRRTYHDDQRVYAASARRDQTTANLNRLMSQDTADSTAALMDAKDVNRRKLQPWQAAWENLKSRAGTVFEKDLTFGLDVADAVGNTTAWARNKAAEGLRNAGMLIPGGGALADLLDPQLTDAQKKMTKEDLEKDLAAQRVLRDQERAKRTSDNFAHGLNDLNDHFSRKKEDRVVNKPKKLLPRVK